jgi:uncharacterized CHY-type Zn-finger protein
MPIKIDKIAQYNRAVDYAKSRNGECLSTEYTKAKDKMLWKCDNPAHPQWESPFDSMVSGQKWCTLCGIEKNANKNRLSDGLERAHKHAQSKGGQCLSTEYMNAKEPMLWKCDNPEHPVWQSNFDHVVSRDRWCQQCAYDKSIMSDGFKKAQAYAKKQNGQCLTHPDTPIKKHTYLLWKCDNIEHPAWESTFHNIIELNTWCGRCAGKYTEKEYLVKAYKMANEKGGQCLSTEYIDQRSPMIWKCDDESHPFWHASYDDILNKNNWCGKCKGILTPEEYLQKAQAYAISKGGKCISTQYDTQAEKLKWECPKHGVFKSDYVNIVSRKRWCPHCFKEARDNAIFEKAKEYARTRGGEILTIQFINVNRKLEWKCKNKSHPTWWGSPRFIVGQKTWCPECGLTYSKEKRVRIMLEYLLGFSLVKARPQWNLNPKTNHYLELDGYNEKEKIAFEFQGRHHFKENIFKNSNLSDIQYKDAIKLENCLKEGVKLLVIEDNTNTRTFNTLMKHLINNLERENIPYNRDYNQEEIQKRLEEEELYFL